MRKVYMGMGKSKNQKQEKDHDKAGVKKQINGENKG
jgi:hypothetical protein